MCLKDEVNLLGHYFISKLDTIHSNCIQHSLILSSFKMTKILLQRTRQQGFTGLKERKLQYHTARNQIVTGVILEKENDIFIISCCAIVSWVIGQSTHSQIWCTLSSQDFILEDDQGVCRQEDNGGTHWLLKDAQVTQRFLTMKTRPCVSYCRQKNLSQTVAEH